MSIKSLEKCDTAKGYTVHHKGQEICIELRRRLISLTPPGVRGFTINDVRWVWPLPSGHFYHILCYK